MDHSIHLRFYLPNDDSFGEARGTIEESFTSLFHQNWTVEYIEPDFAQEEVEMIYQIHKPKNSLGDEAKATFFENLQFLITEYHKYLPSFTHKG